MIAIFIHPPKTLATGEDYLIPDVPALIDWWEREKIVGNAVLVPVETLRPLLPKHGLDELRAQEGCHVVMVVRR
jgi:hypothetical protein